LEKVVDLAVGSVEEGLEKVVDLAVGLAEEGPEKVVGLAVVGMAVDSAVGSRDM
jgi:hypothetical protein